MLHVLGCIAHQHDLRLVVLAAILCLFACWTAMDLLMRARIAVGRPRLAWALIAGLVFGAGIWATHFIAMLAYRSQFPLGFDTQLTALSIAIAIAFSTLGFLVALQLKAMPRYQRAALGGCIAGVAVSAMHFTGMSALEGPFELRYDYTYVTASVVIGVGLVALGAIVAASSRGIRARLLSSFFWAIGICGMHFTGMSAATLAFNPVVTYDDTVLSPDSLAITVAAVGLLVVALGLMAAEVDNHLYGRRQKEADRLRAHIAVLEETQRNLESTTRNLNEALLAASAAIVAKSEFMAQMSHELRTPLNAILGFSEILKAEAFGPLGSDRYRDYIADIHNSGEHLLEIVNTILDLTSLQSGKIELQETVFSVRELIAESLRSVSEAANSAGLRLLSDCPGDLPDVRAGRRRIGQVLLNLLSNAIKFTPAGGSVTVCAGVSEAGLFVRVTDTGIGISEKDLPKALDRFGQIDSRLSRKYEGAGLGLPISNELMKVHGGSLEIQSTLDKGTTVTITFPKHRIVALTQAA